MNTIDTLHEEIATREAERDVAREEANALKDEVARLKRFEVAFDEWYDKTQWVQDTSTAKELGKHRADVLRERIEDMQTTLRNALQALEHGEIKEAIDQIEEALAPEDEA
jgi:hypothetical protein